MEDSKLEAGARLAVTWEADRSVKSVNTLDHVTSYMRTLVEALTLAVWEPLRLDAELRVTPRMIVELDVEGEVPGLDQAGFAKLASVAIAACNLWQALAPDAELRLRPRLNGHHPIRPALAAPASSSAAAEQPPSSSVAPVRTVQHVEPPTAAPASPSTEVPAARPRLATRVIVAVLFGGLLGLFGLPRLIPTFELPTIAPAAQPLATLAPTLPPAVPPTQAPTLAPVVPPTQAPTLAPTTPPTSAPTATTAPTQVVINVPVAPAPTRVLFAERFVSPLAGWPHAPDGNAWFANGRYEMRAREPGRFIAIETPLGGPVGEVSLSARFRKTGGPPGGGYGFVVRNQGTARLDGETQQGKYIVVEVSDRGDIGIWQRDETRWIDIVPWTMSSAVHQGLDPNELLLTTQGRSLRFVVNGVEVANTTYNAIPAEGGVGVFVGGDLNEVSLEWLIVERPDASSR